LVLEIIILALNLHYRYLHHGKVPVCVDESSGSIPGSAAELAESVLYFIEATCSGIPCPPYTDGAEITCVVCTK
jgi:hypothetical protein